MDTGQGLTVPSIATSLFLIRIDRPYTLLNRWKMDRTLSYMNIKMYVRGSFIGTFHYVAVTGNYLACAGLGNAKNMTASSDYLRM